MWLDWLRGGRWRTGSLVSGHNHIGGRGRLGLAQMAGRLGTDRVRARYASGGDRFLDEFLAEHRPGSTFPGAGAPAEQPPGDLTFELRGAALHGPQFVD
jgi:hypothetical protein